MQAPLRPSVYVEIYYWGVIICKNFGYQVKSMAKLMSTLAGRLTKRPLGKPAIQKDL
jgi:hypothetical protein